MCSTAIFSSQSYATLTLQAGEYPRRRSNHHGMERAYPAGRHTISAGFVQSELGPRNRQCLHSQLPRACRAHGLLQQRRSTHSALIPVASIGLPTLLPWLAHETTHVHSLPGPLLPDCLPGRAAARFFMQCHPLCFSCVMQSITLSEDLHDQVDDCHLEGGCTCSCEQRALLSR